MKHTYKISLIAMLAALAISGRFALQFLPNIQPVTSLVILTGFFFGSIPAALLGIITILISNLFLGMGIWTLSQLIAFTLIGLISGIVGKCIIKHQFFVLIIMSILAAFCYGLFFAISNYLITGFFWGYYIAGLIFDCYHAFGNVLFMLVSYKPFSLLAKHYKIHYSSL
ncbi:hypothetical protein Pryu01_00428 [Paraliobacillus ryukyuensis]|uniref:Energy-coupling factor transport system substrate-specific component n=1 Tax=Paraliobacillus ryukyuensis TaxID=200904 RepID=A0A366EIF2_9BACI|nr:ECF transporter S component [Paraliobacillus ryukyuensis]RBP01500.1 energy-coupling factor transport system substrate-specific component [Paraliobacillus ryukyuensis]